MDTAFNKNFFIKEHQTIEIAIPTISRVVVTTRSGREFDKSFVNNNLTISIQDDGKTIKLFIKD